MPSTKVEEMNKRYSLWHKEIDQMVVHMLQVSALDKDAFRRNWLGIFVCLWMTNQHFDRANRFFILLNNNSFTQGYGFMRCSFVQISNQLS